MQELPTVRGLVEEAVAAGRIPGAVVVVRHDGTVVHSAAHGVLDPETAFPLTADTVFWLASLSKVAGAIALLMLAEEGGLDVSDPVSAYIPEFAVPGRILALRPGSPSPLAMPFGPPPDPLPGFDVVPADRELTLFDLLTHTGGLQSIMRWNPEFIPPVPGQTLADYVPGLGGLARDFQAGHGWAYSNAAAFDVLSRVIEIVSGQDLGAFLDTRIFQPLGVGSMGFGRGGQGGSTPVPPIFLDNPVIAGDTFRSTSAGLWGSGPDYLVVAEMLRARRSARRRAPAVGEERRAHEDEPGGDALSGPQRPSAGTGCRLRPVGRGDRRPGGRRRGPAVRHLRLGRRRHAAVLGLPGRSVVGVLLRPGRRRTARDRVSGHRRSHLKQPYP